MQQRMKLLISTVAVAAIATTPRLAHVSARPMTIQGTAAPSGTCRAYSTDETRVSSQGTLHVTCKFDTATKQHVCHDTFTGSSEYSYDQTTQYASVADFVGDPARVVFFPHAQSITVRLPGSTSRQVYAYDGRGYLTSIATTSSAGTGASTTQKISAWDSFGRPTAGRDETQSYGYSYDDAKRLFTQRASGPGGVITVSFDADANQIASTTVTPTFRDTSAITIKSTERICK